MKRKRVAIITGVAAASITFGTLFATLGHLRHQKHCHHHMAHYSSAEMQHHPKHTH